jgi:2-amino-4-hydroxy-6-hydroxymethyldihydropteridine diphosphokinase
MSDARAPVARVAAYVGIGSNLGDPPARVRAALDALGALPRTRLVAASPLYANPPFGPVPQPEFVNAVAALDTALGAIDLLHHLRAIEQAHGRVRDGTRWGPRSLDLDLLLYGDAVIAIDGLTVPHPGLPERNFVLYPLADVAPGGLEVPGLGPLAALLAACPSDGLRKLGD